MKSIDEFKGIHEGKTIYVIGSGPTMQYINREFFVDKICVGLNRAAAFYPVDYVCIRDYPLIQAFMETHTKPIICYEQAEGFRDNRHPTMEEWANRGEVETTGRLYLANHSESGEDYCPQDGHLATGRTCAVLGISFAAWMGAKFIVLCGIDCGSLDAEHNYAGYCSESDSYRTFQGMVKPVADFYRAKGIGVYSLNPFINPGMEGHLYES